MSLQMDLLSLPHAIFLFLLITICISARGEPNVFNVLSYGASGHGFTDDSLAFIKAWNSTCNAAGTSATMVIPKEKQFLVHPITFTGPCKSSSIHVEISGTILAPNSTDQWKGLDQSTWIEFKDISGLQVDGFGTLDGRGKAWWDQSCKWNPSLQGCTTLAPTALKFQSCNNITMSNMNIKNSPQAHVSLLGCQNVNFGFLNIQSPGNSPNTDGIHLQIASNIFIHNSKMASGDDCISIGDKISDINVSDINCGPGHGVSIGSLGKDGSVVQVKNINVTRVNFHGTTNGARIKTWQAGRGLVQNVHFSNLNFTNVQNPIIIDQFYCNHLGACKEMKTGVHISDVRYTELIGTSNTKVAINLNCSDHVPCTGIMLNDIRLTSANRKTSQLVSSCNNAYGLNRGTIEPESCLRK